ncbi:MAG: hypothetical protein COV07_03440 [Candidatus Vogelbacteria bacterium CG10_big_fil_rev_8_21_14_0_10_45_14]|uniref:Uncharacterized protein n=1 Tax=Candidatus Vogelbacteria bacterium CG10_big_fil_rev_8_21_14_0_10_45_14 TaxID=1975042 RepID=A0A2H0RJ74_9BACT|nr:MAG: hypothetical protein COV07_03440 [Candidatus Vogelbacteria bacterium CG10_big_fil_rev_8_21_14_0_10_45_14]
MGLETNRVGISREQNTSLSGRLRAVESDTSMIPENEEREQFASDLKQYRVERARALGMEDGPRKKVQNGIAEQSWAKLSQVAEGNSKLQKLLDEEIGQREIPKGVRSAEDAYLEDRAAA